MRMPISSSAWIRAEMTISLIFIAVGANGFLRFWPSPLPKGMITVLGGYYNILKLSATLYCFISFAWKPFRFPTNFYMSWYRGWVLICRRTYMLLNIAHPVWNDAPHRLVRSAKVGDLPGPQFSKVFYLYYFSWVVVIDTFRMKNQERVLISCAN